MKKLSFVMTLMLAMLLLASCSKNQGTRLIPDNAFAVIRLDVMKTMESVGMKGDDTSVKEQIEALIKNAGLDKEAREKLMEIIDDPTSSGIDFTEPIFLYFSLGGSDGIEGGITGTTASKGNLTDAIKMLEKMDDNITLEEYKSDGVQYARLERSTVIIFNGDWFYIGPVDNGDDWESDVEDTIEDLLDRAAGNNNLEEHPALQKMAESKGLIQIGMFGSGFDGLPGMSQLTSQLPEGCELKDVSGVLDFIINKGEIVMEGEALLMSDAWKKQVEMYGIEEIEESQTKYADAEGALAVINIDPKAIYQFAMNAAKSYELNSEALKQIEELKPIFDAFTGKGMVAINSWEEGDDPEIVAYVGTKDNKLLDKLVGDQPTMEDRGITSVANNEYRVPIDYDYDYNDSIGDFVMTPTKFIRAGWKDNQTYFLMNTEKEPFTASRKPFTDVKGVGFFAYVSGKLLGQAVSSIDDDAYVAGKAVADLLDYMELYYESSTKGVFRIAMKKKDKSPVVTIIDYVKHHFM